MATETATGETPTMPRGSRSGGAWRRVWDWTMDVLIGIKVPLGLFFLLVVVGAIVAVALSSRTEYIDARQREADRREALTAAYAADVRAYDNAVNDRNDCLDRVTRSDLNRGQHEATVEAFESLKLLFPDSQGVATAVDQLAASMRAGPLLSSQPFSVEDCPAMPVPPVLPPELGGSS